MLFKCPTTSFAAILSDPWTKIYLMFCNTIQSLKKYNLCLKLYDYTYQQNINPLFSIKFHLMRLKVRLMRMHEKRHQQTNRHFFSVKISIDASCISWVVKLFHSLQPMRECSHHVEICKANSETLHPEHVRER